MKKNLVALGIGAAAEDDVNNTFVNQQFSGLRLSGLVNLAGTEIENRGAAVDGEYMYQGQRVSYGVCFFFKVHTIVGLAARKFRKLKQSVSKLQSSFPFD